MREKELLAALGDALNDDEVIEADPSRIAAVRRAVAASAEVARTGPRSSVETGKERDRRWGRGPRTGVVAAAAIVVSAAFVAGVVLADGEPARPAGEVEYAGPITGNSARGDLVVTKTGIGRIIALETDELPILPAGEFYEVWFVGRDDTPESPERISAGTFHPDEDGRSEVTLTGAVDPALLPVVEITAEPADGDPAPTDEIVLRADLSR